MKDRLTIETAIANNYSAVDCVKYYWPEISDKDADFILWEETCFPCDNEAMLSQLYNKYSSQ